MSVIDEASAARLTCAPLGWLTTVRSDGQPQTSYIWFHCDGEDLVMLSQPTAQKLRNLASDPKVSFHLDGDGSAGDGVLTIDATAEVLGDRLAPDRLAAYLAKYEDRIRHNLNWTPAQYHESYSVAIRVIPMRLRAW